MIPVRRFFALVAVFVALAAIVALPASAESFSRGKTVWFSHLDLGEGDVVRGNLDIVFGSVTCDDGAVVDGDVRTFFGSFDQLDGCAVGGRVVHAFDDGAVPWLGPLSSDDLFTQYDGFFRKLGWDVVVLFAFLLFPMRVRVALDRVEKHPGLSGAAGLVAAVALFPIAILLVCTVVGIPLVPILFAAFLACVWIGYASVGMLIGRRLYELLVPHASASPLGALALGLLVVSVAESFPLVGWAVGALVLLVGLGAACLAFVRETSFRDFTHGVATTSGRVDRPA